MLAAVWDLKPRAFPAKVRSGFASDNAKKQRDRAFPMVQEKQEML